ncbi:transmembrane protein, putative [Medicago truncatula]|uniref:Transmembrane protein, putative n=1 Tax=Medicago truncatula TaxID=3880 RepID=A0A072TFV1_MEDTR|nr:transmembrane protein, putative [Medicago truncatula]
MLTFEESGLTKMHNISSHTALHIVAQRDFGDSSQQLSNHRQNNYSGFDRNRNNQSHPRGHGQCGVSHSDGSFGPAATASTGLLSPGSNSIHPGLLSVRPHLLGVCLFALIIHLSGFVQLVLRGNHAF